MWKRYGRKLVALPIVGFFPAGAYVAYKYRPRSSLDVDYHEKLRGSDRAPSGYFEASLYYAASAFTIGLVTSTFKAFMHTFHDLELLDQDKLLQHIVHNRDGRPLLTFANHVSTLDDPMLTSCMLPNSVTWVPKRMRWGICTEEICFSSPLAGAFFGMGRALPVQRGGSIHQKGVATLQGKINAGEWVHVFPEGKVWQEAGTPPRDEEGRRCSAGGRCAEPWGRLGPFKWGVGKLIANASQTPLVVPYFHMGMNELMPQSRDNETLSSVPQRTPPRHVTVKFGDPVEVSDLLTAYHSAARQRALARNGQREARLREALEQEKQRAALATAAAAAVGAGIAGRQGGGNASRASTAQGQRSWWGWATGAVVTPAGPEHFPAPYSSSAHPIPRVSPADDHADEGAHIAGLPSVLRGAAALEALRADERAVPEGLDMRGGILPQMKRPGSPSSGGTRGVGDAGAGSSGTPSHSASSPPSPSSSSSGGSSSLLSSAAGEISSAARARAAAFESRLRDLESAAKERVREVEAAARELEAVLEATAKDVEGRARELAARLRKLQGEQGEGGRGPVTGAAGTGEPGAAPSPPAASSSSAGGGGGKSLGDLLQERLPPGWRGSVSIPPPVPEHRLPGLEKPTVEAAAQVEAAASVSVTATAPGRSSVIGATSSSSSSTGEERAAASPLPSTPATAPPPPSLSVSGFTRLKAGDGGAGSADPSRSSWAGGGEGGSPSAFPLSEAPVVEVVPSRVLRTGAVVPTYIEAPLRAKPPDHAFLSPAEAAEEEELRLQLYADLAARLQGALRVLERQVMAHRAGRGIVEERPMS